MALRVHSWLFIYLSPCPERYEVLVKVFSTVTRVLRPYPERPFEPPKPKHLCLSVSICGSLFLLHSCPFVFIRGSLSTSLRTRRFPICPSHGLELFLIGFYRPRAWRAHASERRMCITVGAAPGGRRTYGQKPPHTPARRAALRDLSQPDDFYRFFLKRCPEQRFHPQSVSSPSLSAPVYPTHRLSRTRRSS